MMKIVLSRKGFDSRFGGFPSPILPNGRIITMPIPLQNELRYSELKYSEDKTYFDLMRDLYPRICLNGKWKEFTKSTKCHLDPDLNYNTIKRKNGWKPMFGQVDQAQSHLENQNIGLNDIFLFFGLFQHTKKIAGKNVFDNSCKPFHCIWGYLQVGKIYKNDKIIKLKHYHPHTERELLSHKNNTIYEATDKLTISLNRSGAESLKFSEKLVLTKKGHNSSQWELPNFFEKLNITYHTNSKNYGFKGSYFQSAARGQEFVIQEDEKVIEWFLQLID